MFARFTVTSHPFCRHYSTSSPTTSTSASPSLNEATMRQMFEHIQVMCILSGPPTSPLPPHNTTMFAPTHSQTVLDVRYVRFTRYIIRVLSCSPATTSLSSHSTHSSVQYPIEDMTEDDAPPITVPACIDWQGLKKFVAVSLRLSAHMHPYSPIAPPTPRASQS